MQQQMKIFKKFFKKLFTERKNALIINKFAAHTIQLMRRRSPKTTIYNSTRGVRAAVTVFTIWHKKAPRRGNARRGVLNKRHKKMRADCAARRFFRKQGAALRPPEETLRKTRLSLRELGCAACLFKTVLLALFDAGVTR